MQGSHLHKMIKQILFGKTICPGACLHAPAFDNKINHSTSNKFFKKEKFFSLSS